jgi:phosphoglycerate dehydrogenase-like enzyme
VGTPRIAVFAENAGSWMPDPRFLHDAIRDGGGAVVDVEDADGIVWCGPSAPSVVRDVIGRAPELRWVQLPMAGVERFAASFADDGLCGADGRRLVWTSAKGAASGVVAEHAVGLMLAGLRNLVAFARADDWLPQSGRSLIGADVTILGAGGITEALLGMLAAFDVRATVVRKRPAPVAGAARVVGVDQLHQVIANADIVVVALALTEETKGIIDAAALRAMRGDAWLINVARGEHVVTDDLVAALSARTIGGAALDVTLPEPLPAGHPLWRLPNCIVTPHVGSTRDMARPHLAQRVRDNVRRFAAGEPLLGVVDSTLGY